MTDKEKIVQIMHDKQLNNTQFSSMLGISAGALSHIMSGRSNPTLNVLRSITDAFPDINPKWLFFDEGAMYLADDSDGAGNDADGDGKNEPLGNEVQRLAFQGDLFDAPLHQPQPQSHRVSSPNAVETSDKARSTVEMLDIKEIVEQSVAQTVDHLKQKQRRIVEVRVFFDDGTFETFCMKGQ